MREPEHLAEGVRALAPSEAPIVDIALECGFDSLSHFYRVFRKRIGETPRAYRLRGQASIR